MDRDRRRPRRFGQMLSALMGVVVVMGSATWVHAQTDRKISIAVDNHRDCGDLDGRRTHRLERRGEKVEITVNAESYWNASGLVLEKGVRYTISPKPNSIWKDWGKEAGVEGWEPESGFLKWFMSWARPLVRSPDEKLFQLMCLIWHRCGDSSRSCVTQFPIKTPGRTILPSMDGEFCAYANDLPFMYWNNSGEISLVIERK